MNQTYLKSLGDTEYGSGLFVGSLNELFDAAYTKFETVSGIVTADINPGAGIPFSLVDQHHDRLVVCGRSRDSVFIDQLDNIHQTHMVRLRCPVISGNLVELWFQPIGDFSAPNEVLYVDLEWSRVQIPITIPAAQRLPNSLQNAVLPVGGSYQVVESDTCLVRSTNSKEFWVAAVYSRARV